MLSKRKNLPIGIQSFKRIIEEDFVYIDKTKYIHELTKTGVYYFLARPRRFGKTLLCTTLEQLFQGNRDLFQNLAITATDYSWEKYPVIFISFATMAPKSADILRKVIEETIDNIAERSDIILKPAATLGAKFKSLILELSKKNKVVILIDEYDAAILKNIKNLEVADACREVLSDFFSPLKDGAVDEQLRFVFITGITKFSKTSIFSGLNNLQDLSLDVRAARLLGYTKDEIKDNYQEYLHEISQKTGTTHEKIMEEIQFWYDGYQFVNPAALADAHVYNPYSVMLYLQNGEFDNYWFDTGTPSFLLRLIKAQDYPVQTIDNSELNKDDTKSYEIDKIEVLPLLLQAGYLTIKSYDPFTKNFKLTFPNNEVRISFFQFIVLAMSTTKKSALSSTTVKLTKALQRADLKAFFEALVVYFAQFPYSLHIPLEKHYQTIFFGIMALLGADIRAEEPTNDGRIDATIETSTHIFLFEFKLNGSAERALAQIEEKKYYQKYLQKGKTIVLVGVSFSTEKEKHRSMAYKRASNHQVASILTLT